MISRRCDLYQIGSFSDLHQACLTPTLVPDVVLPEPYLQGHGLHLAQAGGATGGRVLLREGQDGTQPCGGPIKGEIGVSSLILTISPPGSEAGGCCQAEEASCHHPVPQAPGGLHGPVQHHDEGGRQHGDVQARCPSQAAPARPGHQQEESPSSKVLPRPDGPAARQAQGDQ